MKARRGAGIIEFTFVAIAALVLTAWVASSVSRGTQEGGDDQRTVRELLISARATAMTSGNGATVAFAPNKNSETGAAAGYTAIVYSGRPNTLGLGKVQAFPAVGASVVTAGANVRTFSVMFSSSGSASLVPNWTPPAAYPLVGEPVCSGGVPVWIHAKGESPGTSPPPGRVLVVDCTTGDIPLPRRF